MSAPDNNGPVPVRDSLRPRCVMDWVVLGILIVAVVIFVFGVAGLLACITGLVKAALK